MRPARLVLSAAWARLASRATASWKTPAGAPRGLRALFLVVAVVAAGAGRAASGPAATAPVPAARQEALAMDELAGARGASQLQEIAQASAFGEGRRTAAALPDPVYRRNVWVPLLEAGVVVVGLNYVDRQVLGQEWARTDGRTFLRNLGRWEFDDDSFDMNNLLHPFTGSIYYGAARSMGLDPWRSFGVAFLGSALWELGGETQAASINDQIMTPVAGSFLGEVLYRCAVLVLGGGDGSPGFWREGAAFLLSPPTGVNRRLFDGRYRTFDFDQRPITYLEAWAGVDFDRTLQRESHRATAGLLGLHLVYGLPGDGSWRMRHPFDHFDLQGNFRFTGLESSSGELFIRGMLAGSRIEGAWRGVWGLTGVFDYAAPGAFDVSTAALGVSTTGQLGDRGGVALQGTVLLGAGFGTGGAVGASANGSDFHRGPAGQLVAEARLALGARAVIGAGLRQYLIAGVGGTDGIEALSHLTLSARLRVAGRHAIGIEWLDAQRWSRRAEVPDSRQRSSGMSVSYVLVTDPWFGVQPRRRPPGNRPPAAPTRNRLRPRLRTAYHSVGDGPSRRERGA